MTQALLINHVLLQIDTKNITWDLRMWWVRYLFGMEEGGQ